MPNNTTNYNLKKPLGTENYNVEDQNGNMDIIDTLMKSTNTAVASKETPEGSQEKVDAEALVREDADTALDTRVTTLEQNITHDVSSWAELQDTIRRGLALNTFSPGDQLAATYAGVEYIFDIIGINHDTPTDITKQYSMTIQLHDCLLNAMFDAPEPTNPDANIKLYGYNNYVKSAVRQWLNSSASMFNWVSQHAYDVAPTGAPYTGAGFLYGLDPELVAVMGAVNKQVARNTVTDAGGQDLFSDKVFLLSRLEIYGTAEGIVTGEKVYDFYKSLAAAATDGDLPGRIKYLSGAARIWWLRSPGVGYSRHPRTVYPTGYVTSTSAYIASGLAPACCIV